MTSEKIAKQIKSIYTLHSFDDNDLMRAVLWEIAFQLALANEGEGLDTEGTPAS